MTDRTGVHDKETVDFNSHAHVERDVDICYRKSITNNFNSHAHVERDGTHPCAYIEIPISTHTLTWSVTQEINKNGTNI